jgi:putative DNA primase/helicase
MNRDLLDQYRANGLKLVPVPVGRKSPVIKGWNLPVDRDIGDHENVGVLTGSASAIADVDLDSPVAVSIARELLDLGVEIKGPFAVFGRVGKQVSHIMIRQARCRAGKVLDPITRACLVEVRGDSQQTIIPPSTHPSGEELVWSPTYPVDRLWTVPTDLMAAESITATISVGSLLVPTWTDGVRNDLVVAVAGFLLKLGWDKDRVRWVVSAVAGVAGDRERTKREHVVDSTYERIVNGEPVVGASGLEDLVDRRVIKAIARLAALDKPAITGAANASLLDMTVVDRIVSRDMVRFDVVRRTWLKWTGAVWEDSRLSGIVEEVQAVKEELVAKGNATDDVIGLGNYRRVRDIAALASMDGRLTVVPDDLDADPFYLNCPNGTADLRTGEIREPSKADLCTHMTGVAYDPAAVCPMMMGMLTKAVSDPKLVKYLQLALGVSVVGLVTKNVFLVYGPTDTGKTTFVTKAIKGALGTYARSLPPAAIGTGSRQSEMWLSYISTSRMGIISEPPRDLIVDPGFLKSMTGSNVLVARALYSMPVEMIPRFTVWIDTNHRPEVPDSDDSIWVRLKPVHFKNKVRLRPTDPGYVPDFAARLEEELPGVLAWIIRGAVEALAGWNDGVLDTPEQVASDRTEWREETDTVSMFVEEELVHESAEPSTFRESTKRVPTKEVYQAYVNWCRSRSVTNMLGRNSFISALEERGFKKVKWPSESWSWDNCTLRKMSGVSDEVTIWPVGSEMPHPKSSEDGEVTG